MDQILDWASAEKQNWLIEFFQARLGDGAAPRDPKSELLAAIAESEFADAPEAIVLTDAGGRVLCANHYAEHLLQTARWLLVKDGCLRGAHGDNDRMLKAALTATLAARGRTGTTASAALRLTSAQDGTPLFLRVTPYHLSGPVGAAMPFAALRFMPGDQEYPLDAECLKIWYGLSQAEARLAAAFAMGTSLADYAADQGLSINTVRTHFAHVKVKLEAADQADVVRKLLLAGRLR